MIRRFNVLNIILLIIIILISANIYKLWNQKIDYSEYIKNIDNKPDIKSIDDEAKDVDVLNKDKDKVFPSFYDTVVDKDIFRPERSEWKPPPPPPPPPPAPPAPPPIEDIVMPNFKLKGVILMDDGKKVAVVDGSFKKVKKVQIVVQNISGGPSSSTQEVEVEEHMKDRRLFIGDRAGSYTVSEILPDSLILIDNFGNKIVLTLGNAGTRKDESGALSTNSKYTDNRVISEGDTIVFNMVAPKAAKKLQNAQAGAGKGGAAEGGNGSGGQAGGASSGGGTAGGGTAGAGATPPAQNVSTPAPDQRISGR